jgi:hypothetical protein
MRAWHRYLAIVAVCPLLAGCDAENEIKQLKAQQQRLEEEVRALTKRAATPRVAQPEQCVLDTLKSSSSADVGFVRWTCIRQYIKANIENSQVVPPILVSDARLVWSTPPTMLASVPLPEFREAIENENVTVTFKNDSSLRIIAADIAIHDNGTNAVRIFRGYADAPIEPSTVGKIMALTNLETPNGQTFAEAHTWNFYKVFGVPTGSPP